MPDIVLSTLCVSSHLNGFNILGDSYSYSPSVIERKGKVEKCAVNVPQITSWNKWKSWDLNLILLILESGHLNRVIDPFFF